MHSLAKDRPAGAWKSKRGGLHLPNPAFMPLVMVKELTAIEYAGQQQWANMTLASLNQAQEEAYALMQRPQWRARMRDLWTLPAEERALLAHVPWWLACNPLRFSYWYGKLSLAMWLCCTSSSRLQKMHHTTTLTLASGSAF